MATTASMIVSRSRLCRKRHFLWWGAAVQSCPTNTIHDQRRLQLQSLRFLTKAVTNYKGAYCWRDSRSDVLTSQRYHSSTLLETVEKSIPDEASSEIPRTGLYRLLNEQQRELLHEQRQFTHRTRQLCREILGPSHLEHDTNNNEILDDPLGTFCLVFAGEFNAGKSTVINALLGEKRLETGTLPTTDRLTVISSLDVPPLSSTLSSSSSSESSPSLLSSVEHIRLDTPLLQDLTLIDTPGTNAVWQDHTTTTLRILPSADIIFWITSADRPFPASEQAVLRSMARDYRKRIAIVINKMDLLDHSGGHYGQPEKEKVLQFVKDHASDVLGSQPWVWPVSARDALVAKLRCTTPDQLEALHGWQISQFGALETFLKSSLTTATKIQAKLLNPLGGCEGRLRACRDHVHAEQVQLQLDGTTLQLVDRHVAAWRKAMEQEWQRARHDVQDLLTSEGRRGHVWLQRLRSSSSSSLLYSLGGVPMGGNREAWQLSWQATRPPWRVTMVSTPTAAATSTDATELDDIAPLLYQWGHDTAESWATQGRAQGQLVIEMLGQRPAMKHSSLVGSITAASRYEETRQVIEVSVHEAIRQTLQGYHASFEQESWLRRMQQLSYVTTGLHVSALGCAVATAAQLVDVFVGIPVSGALVLSGQLVWSQGSHRCAVEYEQRWDRRNQQLQESLEAVGQREMERIDRRIRNGVAPYTQYVQTEQDRLASLKDQCDDALNTAQVLRKRIMSIQ
jgi:small GTP-binding protein